MGVRMARSPGGGSSKSVDCCVGKASGELGMGKHFSGNSFKSPVWNNVKKTKARMGTTKPWASMPKRYNEPR
jgi:hypothetical protein